MCHRNNMKPLLLLVSVFHLFYDSLQIQETSLAKKAIHEMRKTSEEKVTNALGTRSHVLRFPFSKLRDLEEAGIEGFEEIESFNGQGDKTEAVSKSLRFWKSKMNETIRPYVEHPENYYMAIDYASYPPESTWNKTAAYPKLKKEIEKVFDTARTTLLEEYDKFINVKATRLEDISNISWRRMRAKQEMGIAKDNLDMIETEAKLDAAYNGDPGDFIERSKSYVDEFKRALNDEKTFSDKQEPPSAKKVIHDVTNTSEDKMAEALGPSSGFEVTKYAVSDLNDLEEAAIEDLKDIEAFKGDGDKVNAVSNSLIFWIDKMNSTIRPFVERPQDFPSAKRSIHEARNSAEKQMRTALGPTIDSGVLRRPLSKLCDLEEAGIEDLDYIAAFKGSGDKDGAVSSSLNFWIGKMNETVKPYVQNPNAYKRMIIEFAITPEEPHWNQTEAYKKIKKEIDELAKSTSNTITQEYEKMTNFKVSKLEDVTNATWKRMKVRQVKKSALMSLEQIAGWAKQDAANGTGKNTYRESIRNVLSDFRKAVSQVMS